MVKIRQYKVSNNLIHNAYYIIYIIYIKFAGTHLYTWVKRDTVRVRCLAQEHSTMSPGRARTQTA